MFNLQLDHTDNMTIYECSSLGNVFNLQRDIVQLADLAECSSLGNVFNLQPSSGGHLARSSVAA